MTVSNAELDELRQKQAKKLQVLKQFHLELDRVEEEKAEAVQGFNDQIKAIHKAIRKLVNEDDAQFEFKFK